MITASYFTITYNGHPIGCCSMEVYLLCPPRLQYPRVSIQPVNVWGSSGTWIQTWSRYCGRCANSSLSAAMGFAEESGLPNEMWARLKTNTPNGPLFNRHKNYVSKGVRMKLSAVSSVVKDKRVVMIDIVRGTTSRQLWSYWKLGATEVHVTIEIQHVSTGSIFKHVRNWLLPITQ